MRRKLFNLAAAVSLVLCALTSALWVRSTKVGDMIVFAEYGIPPVPASAAIPQGPWFRQMSLRSGSGALQVCWASGYQHLMKPSGYVKGDARTARIGLGAPASIGIDRSWDVAGIRYFDRAPAVGPQLNQWGYRYIDVPYWLFVVASGLPPLVWVAARYRRRQRSAEGRCLNCGYDLRATPQRCPECGVVAVSAK